MTLPTSASGVRFCSRSNSKKPVTISPWRRNYSEAFRYYRSEWVEQNIGWIFGIVAVLLVVPMVIGHIRKIKWEVDNA